MTASEKVQDPLLNRIIEGYHFLKRIGDGSYGSVYLARHPRMRERLVAVKYFKIGNPDEAQNIQREVNILSRLQHPNVVNIYDAYLFDHYQIIVMELIRGGNLYTAMRNLSQPLDIGSVMRIIEELAFALGYVHSQNILHLDLKPANILLDPLESGDNVRFVLTDFGIAQIINPSATNYGNILGTPFYMSPEHFGFGNNKPDYRSDIYSLGIIFYEMLVGRPPFESQFLLDILNKHAFTPAPLPSSTITHIPQELDNIVAKALRKSPDERFQTCNEIGQALRTLRLGPLSSITGATGGTSTGTLGGIAQAVSLTTTYEDVGTLVPQSLFRQIPVRIMMPDGTTKQLILDSSPLIIGRDNTADICLPVTSISRHHAKVTIEDTGEVVVSDLGSTNGTFIDSVRLPKEQPTEWEVGQYLQIQGCLIRREKSLDLPPIQDSMHMTADQIIGLLDELQIQRSKPSVQMVMSPSVIHVEHNYPHYVQVHITPINTPKARYELRAKPGPGITEQWYTLPAAHTIEAGETHVFDFVIRSPGMGTKAGDTYEIAIEVKPDHPDIRSVVQVLKVKVVPFTRFAIALKPREISHIRRRRANLLIINNGNQSERLTITPQNPDTLTIIPETPSVEIDPGEEKSVRLDFKPIRGAHRQRSRLIFTVSVHTESGIVEYTNGSYILQSRYHIPARLFILWALFVLIIARLLLFGVSLQEQFEEARAFVEMIIQAFVNR